MYIVYMDMDIYMCIYICSSRDSPPLPSASPPWCVLYRRHTHPSPSILVLAEASPNNRWSFVFEGLFARLWTHPLCPRSLLPGACYTHDTHTHTHMHIQTDRQTRARTRAHTHTSPSFVTLVSELALFALGLSSLVRPIYRCHTHPNRVKGALCA